MRSVMISIGSYNPLSCDNYINAGNYFQKQFSNDSNLVIRTALVFAKIVGRGQDVLIHVGLGSIKLIASTAMAIYSIPAAAFDYIPTHHKVAKQASRHFGLALFFMADIPLSLANILKMYPEPLCGKIQQKLSISSGDLKFDQIIDDLLDISNSCTEIQLKDVKKIYQENAELKQENQQLKNSNEELFQKYRDLLKTNLKLVKDQIKQEKAPL